MTPDLLLDCEPEVEPELRLELEPEPAATIAAMAVTVGALAEPASLVEVLPADFPLPALIRFVPNPGLRVLAGTAAVQALAIDVRGPEGLTLADTALTTLRGALKAIETHLADPTAIAYNLHRRLTTVRSEWQAEGLAALETVSRRIYEEHQRVEAVAREERRLAQVEADRVAREHAQREADAARAAQAPVEVVAQLEQQVATTTAPPVAKTAAATLGGSTPVKTYKGRLMGTPGSDEPNPAMADLSVAQRHQVLALMRAVLEGKAPLVFFDLNWPAINKRAVAERSAFAVAGLEAFETGSLRAKAARGRA